MTQPICVRLATAADIEAIKPIVDATLFPADMLEPMISPFLNEPDCRHIWLVAEQAGALVGVTYCEPERMTDGTWNMLAIAVAPDSQGNGVGHALTANLEGQLATQGARVLIAETSGLSDYELTRAFYRKRGYREEARIRDFYAAGEDKIVFWKSLTG
jgi:ribosomal protein S18 acetylase RimI-like enzyme